MIKQYLLILLFFSLISFPIPINAQTYKGVNWSGNLYLGASNMMGDLGGSNFIGSRGIFDWDIKATRPAVGGGLSAHMGGLSLSANFLLTRLAGNDAYSGQNFQSDRNLSVRTDLIESNLCIEYRPWNRKKEFNRFYIYSGIGGIYYQPKAKYADTWHKLRTLGTEGQFLEDNKPYNELALVIPYGIGYKFRLAKSSSIILDLGFRKTFTDYLDDVSSVYADPLLIGAEKGPIAQDLSNQSLSPKAIGDKRGNPDNMDSYHVLSVKYEYIFGGKSGDGCYYNRNPPKSRSTRINQRRMFIK